MCQVKLWSGIGREKSSLGTARTVGEQDARLWQAVVKKHRTGLRV